MKSKFIYTTLMAGLLAAHSLIAGVVHRYSFTSDARDSVGGADGTLVGGASIANKSVVLDGASGYVNLPNDLVSNLNAMTIETWVTDNGSAGWARVWDFGTSVQGEDQSGTGVTYIFLSLPNGGGALMSDYRTAGAEQSLTVPRPPAGQPIHLVWTSDPVAKVGTLYVNGVSVGSVNNFTLTPAAVGSTFNDWLGRSQWNDPYFNGSIDEFRIYDSAISAVQVAIDSKLGPDSLYSDPGPIQTVAVSGTNAMVVGAIQKLSVTGAFASVSGVNLTTLATYSSDNTNVVAILDGSGKIGAISAGTATITATYGGVSGTLKVTVSAVPPKLLHRYSFTADATDSIAGADGTLQGGASIDGGQVVLDGTSGYVDLPNNMFTNLASVTFESWVTDNGSAGWARIYDFGNDGGGEDQSTGGTQYMFLSLPAGDGFLRGAYTVAGPGAPEQIVEWLGGRPDVGTQAHIVWTSDAITHTGRIFVNGTQVAVNNSVTITPADLGPTVNDWLGRSQFADPFFNGSFNEFRIYDSALSPLQIAIDTAAGPDNVVTDPGAISTLTLTASPSMTVGTIQHPSVIADFANVTGVNVANVATYTTDNPTVLSIDPDGTVHGVGPGTAKLTASYGGLSKDASITVVAKPTVLAHRYSFDTNANDSTGTANGTLVGTASVSGGKLVLDGSGTVSLPAGIIDNTYDALTIEAWAHVEVTPDGTPTHLFGFGDGNTKFVRLRTHSAGNNSILGLSGGSEVTAAQSGPIAGNVHIVSVFNPAAGYLEFYVNGRLANTNVTSTLLSAIRGTNDVNNIIGAHDDSTLPMYGSIDEFRIYNGALSPAQIRSSYAAGPSTVGFDAGAVQSVTVSVYGNFLNSTIQRPQVHATSASVANFDVTGVSGLSFASGNTNILAVLADGRVQATGVGTTTLTVTYQGKSSSTSVTTVPAQTSLKHRYSFTSDATDSISGANGELHGDASISGGELLLPNDPTVGRGSFLDLPGELLGGYQALTVEAWVNLDVNNVWARIADFGDYNTGGGGHTYFFLCPHTGGNTVRIAVNDGTGEDVFDNGFAGLDSVGPTHIAAVVDPQGAQTGTVYVNGVSIGSSTFTKPLSTIIDTHNFVGRSLYTGDGFLNGSITEFRVYYGALTADQIATNYTAGPDVVVPLVSAAPPTLTITISGGNAVLSWPDTATGFTLESVTALGGTWTTVPGTPSDSAGSFSQSVSLSAASNSFFRLRK